MISVKYCKSVSNRQTKLMFLRGQLAICNGVMVFVFKTREMD
jgi:hypothetical protein